MMNSDPLLQSWPWPGCSFADLYCGEINPHGLDTHVADFEFSSSLTTTEDFSDDSSLPYLEAIYPEEAPFNVVTWPISYDDVSFVPSEDQMSYDKLFTDCIDDVCGLMEQNSSNWLAQHESPNEGSMSSVMQSAEVVADEAAWQTTLVLPGEDMELDDHDTLLHHLHKAHGQAIETGLVELAEVILRRIREKVGPLGTIMERLGHHLYQSDDKQVDYLKQESSKNFEAAFRAFYETCPFGRFAHLAANTAILEAMPKVSIPIHFVDFDTREGIQWPPVFEALGQVQNSPVRFTSMKWKEGHGSDKRSNFEATKKRLCDYARSAGLMLEVDEMDIEELRMEKKRAMKRGGSNDFMVFNCMVGLPHMGLERSRRDAWEFVWLAKELIATSGTAASSSNNGIVTFGCGDGLEMKTSGGFGSFFEGCMGHFHALFESMEWHFPADFSLARTAIECLFVGPYVSSHASHSMWEEMNEASSQPMEMGFQGCRLSKNNLVEARKFVREGATPYGVRLVGECENEMVLEWKGLPLVRVCAWK